MVNDLFCFYTVRKSFLFPRSTSELYGQFAMTLFFLINIVLLWFAGCWEEGRGGCVSEKRKRPSSAVTVGGGGRESKASRAAAGVMTAANGRADT
jgi:hypothetical protein